MSWLPPLAPTSPERTHRAVRAAVASLLDDAPTLQRARPGLRRDLARDMEHISMVAAGLLEADVRLTEQVLRPQPQASALAAGDNLGLQATRAAGDTIRQIKDAIDFPTYVTGLITGVFRAIWQSNVQQMEAISELLKAVSASTAEFSRTEVSDSEAAAWALKALPFLRATEGGEDGKSGGRVKLEIESSQNLFDHIDEIKNVLGATDKETGQLDDNNLTQVLLPLAKRKIGRGRQQNLATLVMMGLNRLVVDKGQLHASMDMRVDTRSAADSTARSRLDSRTSASATAGGIFGAWGAAAQVGTTVGIVKDDENATSEQIASQAGLRSSVDLTFHTEPVQLDHMASLELRKQIIENTHVPDAHWTEGSILRDDERSSFDQLPDVPTEAPEAPSLGDVASVVSPAAGAAESVVDGARASGDAGGADSSAPESKSG